jgi:hypothetical protein
MLCVNRNTLTAKKTTKPKDPGIKIWGVHLGVQKGKPAMEFS